MAKRLDYIDGLRALAALWVVLTHMWVFSGAPALSFHLGHMAIVLAKFPATGNVGVNLFLVLSGFCLTWPYARNSDSVKNITLPEFLKRRYFRIAPAYYASIVLVMGLFWAEHALASAGLTRVIAPPLPALSEILPHLLFIHNFSKQHVSTINGSYWSLALEFQLYLLFPLFLAAMRRWGIWRVLATVLALQLCYRFWLAWTFPWEKLLAWGPVLPNAVPGRMLDFVAGMTAAFAICRYQRPENKKGQALASYLALATLSVAYYLSPAVGKTVICTEVLWATGFASLIYASASATAWTNHVLSWKPLVSLGVMSYSLYLLHEPLLEVGFRYFNLFMRPGRAFMFGFLYIAFIVAVAAVFYRLVESPSLLYFAKKRKNGGNASGKNAININESGLNPQLAGEAN